jgi:zinc transporter ZupT
VTTEERARRAILVLGSVSAGLGAVGVIVAWGTGFSATRSRPLGWPQHELGLLRFNLLGALLTGVLGALALGGATLRRPILVRLAAGGFALMGLQVLLQAGRRTNWLGSVGSNLGLAIGLAVGLAAADWARSRAPAQG